jgi:hypothetical protein
MFSTFCDVFGTSCDWGSALSENLIALKHFLRERIHSFRDSVDVLWNPIPSFPIAAVAMEVPW